MSDQYSIAHYGLMTRDHRRLEPYIEAVRRAVTPESVVLDIGTGTGVIAFAAAMAGARRVIAVEPNEVIDLARKMAAANGLADKIEFHQVRSTELDLYEKADVIVSDLRGVSPFHPGHIETIIDARRRLLADGGTLIARRDTVYAAPVEIPEAWQRHVGHWDDNLLGLDFSAAREHAANVRFHHETEPEHLLAEPARLATIDYRKTTSPDLDAEEEFEARRVGQAHGFAVWFESEIAEGITVSTAPGEPMLAYGRPVYPLERPLELKSASRVRLRFRTAQVRGSYVTSWSGETDREQFSQTTLGVKDFAPRELDLLRPEARPRPTSEARRLRTFLGWVDDDTPVAELVERAAEHFSFRSTDDAHAWVSRTLRLHARL